MPETTAVVAAAMQGTARLAAIPMSALALTTSTDHLTASIPSASASTAWAFTEEASTVVGMDMAAGTDTAVAGVAAVATETEAHAPAAVAAVPSMVAADSGAVAVHSAVAVVVVVVDSTAVVVAAAVTANPCILSLNLEGRPESLGALHV